VKFGQINNANELIEGVSAVFGLTADFVVRVTPQDLGESFELSLPTNITLISGPTTQSSGDVDFHVRLEPNFFGLLEDAPDIFQIEGIEVISKEGSDTNSYSVPAQAIAVNVNQAATPTFSDLLTNPVRIEMPVNPNDLVAEAILNLDRFIATNSSQTDPDFDDVTHYELALASNDYLEKFGEGREISLRYDETEFANQGIQIDWDEESKKYRFEGLRSGITSTVVLSITTSLLADQAFAQAIFGDLKWTAVNTEPTTGLSKSTDIGLLLSQEVTSDVVVIDGETVQVFFAHTFENDVIEYSIRVGDQMISEDSVNIDQLRLLAEVSSTAVEATLTDVELGAITTEITSDVFVLPNKNQLGLSIASTSDSLSDTVESYFESGYWGTLAQANESVRSNEFTFIDPDFGIEEVGLGYEIGVSTLSDDPAGRLFAEGSLNRIHGTQFNDFLVARAPDQTSDGSVLFGAGGSNTLLGNVGADVLVSGGGRDVLTGNAGADVFQIVADTKSAETSVADLENALDQLLGGGVALEQNTYTVQRYGSVSQTTDQTDTLAEALRGIHDELEIDSTKVDLRTVVTDFSRGFDSLNSDRVVFTGVQESSGLGKDISAHHLTWGANDYIYVVAQSMSESGNGNPNDAFVSALLIPEFSPVDVELTDLESAGIYAV